MGAELEATAQDRPASLVHSSVQQRDPSMAYIQHKPGAHGMHTHLHTHAQNIFFLNTVYLTFQVNMFYFQNAKPLNNVASMKQSIILMFGEAYW